MDIPPPRPNRMPDTQVWPLATARSLKRHVLLVVGLWLALGVMVAVAARSPGGLHRALTDEGGSDGNGLVYTAVMAMGYTLLLLGLCLGRLTRVVVTPAGIQIRGSGRVRRQLNWADVAACRPQYNRYGQLLALIVTDRTGREKRFRFGLFAPAPPLADEIVAAVTRCLGAIGEAKMLPPATEGAVPAPQDQTPGYRLAVRILLAIILVATVWTLWFAFKMR